MREYKIRVFSSFFPRGINIVDPASELSRSVRKSMYFRPTPLCWGAKITELI
jgi:hypothetical protein